jgi:hypothetical protein
MKKLRSNLVNARFKRFCAFVALILSSSLVFANNMATLPHQSGINPMFAHLQVQDVKLTVKS